MSSTRHRLVSYGHDGLTLNARFYPAAASATGAVLIFPTIAGPNRPMFRRAEMLGQLGYHAFIADYYGRPYESFADADEMFAAGRELMGDVDRFRARLSAALEAFRGVEEAKDLPMAVIGYCMGGKAVCEMARAGADLACGVGFHGLLTSERPAGPGDVKTPLLLCHGQDDPMVPPDDVRTFQEEMDAAGASWMVHAYSGAKHGFTDPGSDERDSDAVAYHAAADRMSWEAMRTFFAIHMG